MTYADILGPIRTRPNVIGNLDEFIISNIPYGQVRQTHFQWGALEYDGPLAPGINGATPALQWHFGGVPYPITKAIRVHYTYKRLWDGSGEIVNAAIYLGFQDAVDEYVKPQPTPFVRDAKAFAARTAELKTFGSLTNQALSSNAAVLALQASGVVAAATRPSESAFSELIKQELAGDDGTNFSKAVEARNFSFSVDFDGPAKDSNSHKVFEYTFATLLNNPEMYSELLFWYFAGKPWRITKAMRIPLDDALNYGSTAAKREAAAKDPPSNGSGTTSGQQTDSELAARGIPAVAGGSHATSLLPGRALFIGYAGISEGSGG